MFVLRNVGKLIFGGPSKESIVELPQGQLYLVRPSSPKSFSELIFKDSAARIQRTNQKFQYQLVIQRAYEEGEADLVEDESGEDPELSALAAEHDEKVFLLDKSLRFRSEIRRGEKVLAWRDLSGDNEDLYQFVCDDSVDELQVKKFMIAAQRCQYEREYRKDNSLATQLELSQFCFDQEDALPAASPIQSPSRFSPATPQSFFPNVSEVNTSTVQDPERNSIHSQSSDMSRLSEISQVSSKDEVQKTEAPEAPKNPKGLSILCKEVAELHLFDFQSGEFIIQDPKVNAIVSETGKWEYWIEISNEDRDWVGQSIIAEINPVFNFEYLSFIFNAYSSSGDAYSWLLRFKAEETMTRFQEGLMQALWEQLNQMKWKQNKEKDRDYILEAFQDLAIEGNAEEEEEEEEEGEEDEEEEEEDEEEDEEEENYYNDENESKNKNYNEDEDEDEDEEQDEEDENVDDTQNSEHYDTDEDEDDINVVPDDGNVNSLLAVGYKNDRSFVVRGSKIGVFKHTPENHLEFSTNIARVETPGGKLFSPKKVMLHEEDSHLILQNEQNPHSLYRMDLEYGKIVDDWKIHPDIEVETFAPENKFAQMTHEKTFIGLSKNSLFRIDPRLAGNKLVDSELKQYVSKNDFSAAATTQHGYIAVASNKGDIRMFDRLGINAKTHIPALGEPIIGLDVSADGHWILATCRTYLLLIDAEQKDGKNKGKLGFERSFSKDAKPQPRRLGLTPSHVAQFQHETGCPLSFRTAHFNVGEGLEETSIVSATGPFVVTWSMRKILNGTKEPYSIKRYSDEVKADNFRFGSDKNVIVTLPNEVNMVPRAALKKPTRESIATPFRIGGRSFGSDASRIGTRESGRYKLGREDVVNSPY
ncbi:hypothetical protein K3495_g6610 [Podosphaera aphanis]|nr:hypothetical protein K3495_g6610 [Podosphaera aphanis]